jgi:hypothetical protein
MIFYDYYCSSCCSCDEMRIWDGVRGTESGTVVDHPGEGTLTFDRILI